MPRIGRGALAVAAVALALSLLGTVHASAGGLLDGKSFKVEVGEKGKAKAEDDEISFVNGLFHSKSCDAYGFRPGPYQATTRDGTTTFTAETTSPKEGRIVWKGSVGGERIEGTYVWTKAGQADIGYWFRGRAAR